LDKGKHGWLDSETPREGDSALRGQGRPVALLREAAKGDIVITRHGKPAGVLIGFESEDDWFEYRLENDPRFLRRIEKARKSVRSGRGVRLEDL
jgi:prevent-host-death family protein